MNITRTIMKVNNFIILDRYPKRLRSLLDSYFQNHSEIDKEININNILNFLDNSKNTKLDIDRVYSILSGQNAAISKGFVFGLRALPKNHEWSKS